MDPYNSADVIAPARPAAPAAQSSSFSGVQPGVPLPSAWVTDEQASAGAARTGGSNPYSAPSARLEDLRGHDELALASRGARFAAQLINSILIVAPVIGVTMAIAMPAYRTYAAGQAPSVSANAIMLLTVTGLYLLGMLVYQLVLLGRNGQSLGKKLLGIRIVRTDGSQASLGRLIGLRWLPMFIVGLIPIVKFATFIDTLVIFGSEKRCIHDYIADTIVVDA